MTPRPVLKTLSIAILATAFLAGCSHIPGFKKDEDVRDRRHATTANLEVPPAFTAPDPRRQLVIPEIASARAQAEQQGRGASGLLAATADVRIEGPPEARYLVVSEPPETIWPRLETFLRDEGYTIRRVEPAIGVIETDWSGGADSQPGSGGIMRFLRVARDILFKPDYLDRVRLRIEQGGADEPTRVFVATQRMDLEADDPVMPGSDATAFRWGGAHASPELDAEVMGRLATYLSGQTVEESRAMLDATFQPRAQVIYEDRDTYITSSQPYPRTWNRTGLGLDRLGFDPVSRDEDSGEIVVTHPYPQALYEGLAIRGVSIDRDASIQARVTLKLQPQRDGGTRVEIDRLDVSGGELPRFDAVLLERLGHELR